MKAKTYPIQTVNGTVELDIAGEYFKLMEADAAVDVELLNGGNQALKADGISAGFYQRIRFDKLRITHTGVQTIIVLVAPAEGGSDNFTGTFSLTGHPPGSTHAPAAKTVTNASSTILAANAQRRYLLIQNQDAAGIIYVRGDGGVAAAGAGCIRIGPGDVYEPLVPPTGNINAIGDIASNANVHVIEA